MELVGHSFNGVRADPLRVLLMRLLMSTSACTGQPGNNGSFLYQNHSGNQGKVGVGRRRTGEIGVIASPTSEITRVVQAGQDMCNVSSYATELKLEGAIISVFLGDCHV